jgi:hypothetical protein
VSEITCTTPVKAFSRDTHTNIVNQSNHPRDRFKTGEESNPHPRIAVNHSQAIRISAHDIDTAVGRTAPFKPKRHKSWIQNDSAGLFDQKSQVIFQVRLHFRLADQMLH